MESGDLQRGKLSFTLPDLGLPAIKAKVEALISELLPDRATV